MGNIKIIDMRPKDAAQLLLELCTRDIQPEELGAAEDASIFDALKVHPLLRQNKLGAKPATVRCAAPKLASPFGRTVTCALGPSAEVGLVHLVLRQKWDLCTWSFGEVGEVGEVGSRHSANLCTRVVIRRG